MEDKKEDGYWVSQLTDEQAEDILKRLLANSATRKLKKIVKISRGASYINVQYVSKHLHRYIATSESNLFIQDFKIKGINSYMVFYQFMVERFGEEYAKDFIAYADKYIEENPEDSWAKRLVKFKEAILIAVENLKTQQEVVTE